jgi:hypothetical protein
MRYLSPEGARNSLIHNAAAAADGDGDEVETCT